MFLEQVDKFSFATLPGFHYNKLPEIIDWLQNNCTKYNVIDNEGKFYFIVGNINESLMFKLKWF